jgi:hypothetical protein
MEGRSLADYYVDMLHLPGGGVRLGGKEVGRHGGGDKIWRRRPPGRRRRKTPHGGF